MKIEDEIKGRFRNEYHKGLINLIFTTKHISYDFHQSLKKHGLAEQQYNVLRILRGFRSAAPLCIGFIKERMLDKDSDVSRIVDRLFEKGLVSRMENKNDRRQKSVEITENGLQLLDKMSNCQQKEDTLLTNLTIDEVIELSYLLDKIRERGA
ncbi:MAG: MarR family transcriptional regulator [Bacteroidota bacterium]